MTLGLSCSPALFGERRLLDLRIPNGQPGKAGAAALQSLCAADSPDLLILITLPPPAAAAQKSAWYHALLNAGVVVCIERVERAHLPNCLKQRLEAQNQRAPAGEEGARYNGLRSASRAICWRRIRKSRNWGCFIRRAS